MSNTSLNKSKAAKNDEYYTRLEDIEKELVYYSPYLKGKKVVCNCDSEASMFWTYLTTNYTRLGLKGLTATHYDPNGTYKLDYINGQTIKTAVSGDGSYNSPTSKAILKEADIVITNPPFSLFRDFVETIQNKDFIVIGCINAVTYGNVFPMFKAGQIRLGHTTLRYYVTPDGTVKDLGSTSWFTTLPVNRQELVLTATYNPTDYQTYSNYPAINVNKVKDIPSDYKGLMGVPVNFLTKHCSSQFRIVDRLNNPKLGKKTIYKRVIIERI